MRAGSWLGLAVVVLAVGCESSTPVAQRVEQVPPAAEAPPATPNATAPSPSSYAPSGETNPYPAPPQANTTGEAPPAEPAPTEQAPVREVAQPGVGVRGDTLDHGIIQGPAKAYFQVRERAAFLQIEQALNLYRGLEGRLPQSHDEFMEKVIQANGIQLPELPAGSRYVWDAEKGELMVERPRP